MLGTGKIGKGGGQDGGRGRVCHIAPDPEVPGKEAVVCEIHPIGLEKRSRPVTRVCGGDLDHFRVLVGASGKVDSVKSRRAFQNIWIRIVGRRERRDCCCCCCCAPWVLSLSIECSTDQGGSWGLGGGEDIGLDAECSFGFCEDVGRCW